MKSFSTLCGLIIATASLLPMSARGLDIPYGFDPDRHNRFLSGFATNPVMNPNVLGMPGLDFSGVGWGSAGDRGMNVAMVTPQHFISANHLHPGIGSFLNFLGTDGVVRSYQVQGYQTLNYDASNPNNVSDLIVGSLSAPIQSSDHITIYSVVRPGSFAFPVENTQTSVLDFYRGRDVVYVGRNDQGGTDLDGDGYNDRGGKISKNTIDNVFSYTLGNDPPGNTATVGGGSFGPDATHQILGAGNFEGGDSGSPSFLIFNGQLTALGSHSGVGTLGGRPYNVDSFLPYYIDQINSLISGSGFQLSVITPVPEPGTLALCGIAGAALLFLRRRTRLIA